MTNTKNEQITNAIMMHLKAGKDIRAAIEAVFGPGAYEQIAGHVYDALRCGQSAQ